jgi:hypothetical protein
MFFAERRYPKFKPPIQLIRLLIPILILAVISAGVVLVSPMTGPNSSQSPFLVPAMPGVSITSLLTVGYSVNKKPDGTPYWLVGIPDGLGAFDYGDGPFTMNHNGEIFIQEDPGNQDYVARLWRYTIATDKISPVAQHDPDRFGPGAAHFLTCDEESSGIISVSDNLGEGWYLLDVQAHFNTGDAELVQGGQLLPMYVAPKGKSSIAR